MNWVSQWCNNGHLLCFWMNPPFEQIKWVSDSIKRVTCFIFEWISRLNKSSESVIQWLIQKSHLLHIWMNQPFEQIKWFGDSFISQLLHIWVNQPFELQVIQWLIHKSHLLHIWVNQPFKQIKWISDSVTHSQESLASYLSESAV